jgi:hypothetical protein
MNNLQQLKERLQIVLNESTESDCYQEALSDGIYSCQFETSTALEQWMDIWLKGPHSYEYTKGVQFVSDTWQEIKGD